MTSSAHDADLKGTYFRRTIYPQSFIAVAFIFSELDGGGGGGGFRSPPPRSRRSKKSPVWIGLNKLGEVLDDIQKTKTMVNQVLYRTFTNQQGCDKALLATGP